MNDTKESSGGRSERNRRQGQQRHVGVVYREDPSNQERRTGVTAGCV